MKKQIITVVCSCLVSYLAGWYGGSLNGVSCGIASNETNWKKLLIDADYAEYDRKTGIWRLRTMEDVVSDGFIINKTKK